MKHELLRLEGVTFGEYGQTVLNDLDLVLYRGEILGVFSMHAVVKNGLVGLILGRIAAHAGRLYINNEPSPFEEADRFRYRKVGVIQSVSALIDDLSVSENIFVIRKGFKGGVVDMKLLHEQTRQLMHEFGVSFAPEALVRNLSAVERCSLEIVKAVALGALIVVLQDLSSFMPDADIQRLLSLVDVLKGRGTGFLMVDGSVSHLSEYADRVVVIRNGRNLWSFRRGEVNEDVLKTCFSREPAIDLPFGAEEPLADGASESKALVFDGVQSGALDAFSFVLRRGEELCIVDPEGTRIAEIRALLAGERSLAAGRIAVNGKPFSVRNSWEALDQDLAFIVENPADTMLFPDFTAIDNLCFPSSKKARDFWINPAYRDSCLCEYSQYFEPGALKRYPDELSAQDLLKLVYCRWHLFKPSVVVCVKPFSSIDRNLEDISAFFIDLLLKKGIAVLILTSSAAEIDVGRKKIVINQKNDPLDPKNDL